MKIWALTILKLRDKLFRLAEKIDERVSRMALDPWCETESQFERIMLWNDRKRRIVNLKVIADRMIAVLSEEERLYTLFYAEGNSMQDIADKTLTSKSSVARKIDAALKKCVRVLVNLGFTEETLIGDYNDVAPVARTIKRIQESNFGHTERQFAPYTQGKEKSPDENRGRKKDEESVTGEDVSYVSVPRGTFDFFSGRLRNKSNMTATAGTESATIKMI